MHTFTRTCTHSNKHTFRLEVEYSCVQGCRKFDTFRCNCILNPKMSHKNAKFCSENYKFVINLNLIFWGKDYSTQHCPCMEQFHTALSKHWTVGHSAEQLLFSRTQHCPTIGQLDDKLGAAGLLDTAMSNRLTIGQFDTQLTSHWTVWHSTVRPFDS